MERTIVRLHAVSFVVHLVSGILGLLLCKDAAIDIPVYGHYVSYNLDGATATAAFTKREPQLAFQFNTLKAFAAVELITAGWQILYGLELWRAVRRAPDAVKRWTSRPLRWAEYAVTATLMTLTNLVATGGNDVATFVVATGSSVALQACGFVSELAWRPRGAPDLRMDATNVVVNVQGFILLFTVIGIVMAQVANNENTDRIWVHQTGVYSVYFASFGINSALRAFSIGPWSDFLWTETVYMVLSVTSKTTLFWLSTGATRQVLENRKFAKDTAGVHWDAVRLCAMIIPGVLGAAYLLLTHLYSTPHPKKVGSTYRAVMTL